MQRKSTNSVPCELITHLKGFSRDCLHQQDSTEQPQRFCSEVATALHYTPRGSGPQGGQGWPSAGRFKEQGCLNASGQAWEGGRAWGAAASPSSSLKQQLRVSSTTSQDTGDGGKQGLTCKNGPQTLCVYLCPGLSMERGGTTGLWLQWNPSSLANARQGVKTSAVDVVYSDVSLCPTFQFLPHCCPKMSWKMKMSTITQTPVASGLCPQPISHGAQNSKWSPGAGSLSAVNCYIYAELYSFHSESHPMKLQWMTFRLLAGKGMGLWNVIVKDSCM